MNTNFKSNNIMTQKINNDLTLAGHLAADAQLSANGNVARFTVLRNQGKNNDPVSVRFTMFSKNGSKATPIPTDKLVKGASVRVSGFLRADNWVNKDTGEKHYGFQVVVKNIEFVTKEAEEPAQEEENAPQE